MKRRSRYLVNRAKFGLPGRVSYPVVYDVLIDEEFEPCYCVDLRLAIGGFVASKVSGRDRHQLRHQECPWGPSALVPISFRAVSMVSRTLKAQQALSVQQSETISTRSFPSQIPQISHIQNAAQPTIYHPSSTFIRSGSPPFGR